MERIKRTLVVTTFEPQVLNKDKYYAVRKDVEAELCVFESGLEMLPIDELTRLAKEFGVPLPKLTRSEHVEDNAYYANKSEWYVAKPPFDKVIRYLCTYETTVNGFHFCGEGSAGADNVGGWKFRSYAFEIAHKRAKARCIISALGLEGVITEIEINPLTLDNGSAKDAGGEQEAEKPFFLNHVPIEENQNSIDIASKQQRISLFRIFSRIENSEKISGMVISKMFELASKPELVNEFIEHNSTETKGIEFLETSSWKISDAENIFGFIKSADASKMIVQLGNFSAEAMKKQSNAFPEIKK